jgi:tricarballylate dehydrogenase
MMRDIHADVVVLGAGLAGLAAATTAAAAGARTVVLERAATVGGSAAISGGYVWAIADAERLRAEDPGRFQRHGHLVVDGYRDAIDWLSGFAPPLTEEQPALAGRGHKFDLPVVLAHLTRQLYADGGRVLADADTHEAVRTADGYRVVATLPAGDVRINARALVLATGGRQGDPRVRAGLVGGGFVPPLRGNPWSRGTGARLAAGLGASVNTANAGFYGHLFAVGVEALSPTDYITFALYQSSLGVMLDRSGRRFADERRGDHNNAMALAAAGGRAVLLWSEAVQREAAAAPFIPGSPRLDRWAFSRDRGGRAAVADGVHALGPVLRDWGYHAPPQLDDEARARLGTGRVFAADVVPAITFTFGGVEVDDTGVALDGAREPIAGLFAAGADMSDAYHEGYGGGLCLAVVSGRRAGRLAAVHARTNQQEYA